MHMTWLTEAAWLSDRAWEMHAVFIFRVKKSLPFRIFVPLSIKVRKEQSK